MIYVGQFTHNKNVGRLIEAIKSVRIERDLADTSLTIIGGGGEDFDESINGIIESNKSFVTYLGKIYDVQKLMSHYREHTMFAMVSIHETFGLVYIEALSQGLPVLYTKGQGVDGVLAESAGIGVNPFSVNDIAEGIKKILRQQEYYSNATVSFDTYRWKNIGELYYKEYGKILKL